MARRLGWSDEQIEHLADYMKRGDFTPAEKAALRLAEKMTADHHNLTDEEFAELRKHFDEGQVVELMAAVGVFNYFNRLAEIAQLEPTK